MREGETGLLVEPGDVAALTAALSRYAHDAAFCRTRATAARAEVCERYTLADNVALLRERMCKAVVA